MNWETNLEHEHTRAGFGGEKISSPSPIEELEYNYSKFFVLIKIVYIYIQQIHISKIAITIAKDGITKL